MITITHYKEVDTTHFRGLVIHLVWILLVGCAITGERARNHQFDDQVDAQIAKQWQKRSLELRAQPYIAFTGRVAVMERGRVWNASLHWQQRGDTFEGAGYSLLGSQLFLITGDEYATEITRRGQQSQKQQSNEVIKQLTGLDVTPHMLFGLLIADTGNVQKAIFTDNKPSELTLNEQVTAYYLDYKNYMKMVMPRKIRITSPQGTLTLIISNWSLSPYPLS